MNLNRYGNVLLLTILTLGPFFADAKVVPQCQNFFEGKVSEVELRSKLKDFVFDSDQVRITGFLHFPNLIGEYVDITYAVKGSIEIKSLKGTVIKHDGAALAIFRDGQINVISSHGLAALKIKNTTNPYEPMSFVIAKTNFDGLEKLPNLWTNEGNEIHAEINGETIRGYIIDESSGRIIVYLPSESKQFQKPTFTEVRLESNPKIKMRTPTHPEIPYSIRRLWVVYELQRLQKRQVVLVEQYLDLLKTKADQSSIDLLRNELAEVVKQEKHFSEALAKWPEDLPHSIEG